MEFDKTKKILELREPFDHAQMMAVIGEMAERYPELSVGTLGRSILGRNIPMLEIGKGKKRVVYIGAHHGMEGITAALLIRFVNEYIELWRAGSVMGKIPMRTLGAARSICIVPMLNPDGVEYALHGITEDNPMRERVITMNGGSHDFCHWQANARGVDLNHNYHAGFEAYKSLEGQMGILGGAPTKYSGEHPESEPETAYLCNYIRFQGDFSLALTLHTQGEEIYYTSCGESMPAGERIARYLAELSDYRLAKPEGTAAYGGFTDWFIREFHKPSFTIECGKGQNPLPFSDLTMIYLRIRKMLYTAPMLI